MLFLLIIALILLVFYALRCKGRVKASLKICGTFFFLEVEDKQVAVPIRIRPMKKERLPIDRPRE
jgi:hypothetical protein